MRSGEVLLCLVGNHRDLPLLHLHTHLIGPSLFCLLLPGEDNKKVVPCSMVDDGAILKAVMEVLVWVGPFQLRRQPAGRGGVRTGASRAEGTGHHMCKQIPPHTCTHTHTPPPPHTHTPDDDVSSASTDPNLEEDAVDRDAHKMDLDGVGILGGREPHGEEERVPLLQQKGGVHGDPHRCIHTNGHTLKGESDVR